MSLSLNTGVGQKYRWFDENEDVYEELKSFAPRLYDRILEMQKIYVAESRMIKNVQIALEIALNSIFISYMDEEQITALEAFLLITPDANSTLDERKQTVIQHFSGFGKISADVVRDIASRYDIDADLSFDEQDEAGNFLLRIKLKVPRDSETAPSYIEAIKILEIRLPAHLWKIYNVCIDAPSDVGLAQISTMSRFLIVGSDEITEDDLKNIPDLLTDEAGIILWDESANILIDQ